MRDRDLCAQILGITSPWHVSDVRLDVPAGKAEVIVEHRGTVGPAEQARNQADGSASPTRTPEDPVDSTADGHCFGGRATTIIDFANAGSQRPTRSTDSVCNPWLLRSSCRVRGDQNFM
jgi:hypothetical protein